MPPHALITLAFALPPADAALGGDIEQLVGSYSKRHAITPRTKRSVWRSHCMDAVGFRLCFTPLAGVLFTVPSRYCALSVRTSSLPWTVGGPASHRISRVRWYSRSVLCTTVRQRTGLSPAVGRCSNRFRCRTWWQRPGWPPGGTSHNPSVARRPCLARRWFRQQPVSLATTPGGVVFPRGTEMFQFPRFPPPTWRCAAITLRGLPHSETVGSVGGSPSPTLSLLTGVLHRLVLPRHSPTAPSVLPGLWHLGCQKMVLDYKTLDPMNRSACS